METILTTHPVNGHGTDIADGTVDDTVHSDSHSSKNANMKAPFDRLEDRERIAAIGEFMLETLANDKAEDIITIDLDGKSEIADIMIIASGRSARHVSALSDKLIRSLKEIGLTDMRSEGQPNCDWVLVDAGDIIVHLFRPEVRDFYNLERIWSEAARSPVTEPTTPQTLSGSTTDMAR